MEDGESGISLSKKGFVQSFDYKTLEKATGGFKDGNLVGRGGFGDVYKACLGNNNTLAAVKKIENVSQEAKREFQVPKNSQVLISFIFSGFFILFKNLILSSGSQNEVDLLSKIHHPNIISLFGYGNEISSSFIVYELMENGSLDAQLHGKKSSKHLLPPSHHLVIDH